MYVAFRWKQARLRYTPGHTESHSARENTVSRRLLRYSSVVFNLNITNPVNTLKLARPSFQILIQTIAIRRGFPHSSGRAAIFLPAIGRARVVACRVVLQFGSRQIYQPRRATKYLHTFQVITGCISKNYARSLMDRTVVARRCFRKFFSGRSTATNFALSLPFPGETTISRSCYSVAWLFDESKARAIAT